MSNLQLVQLFSSSKCLICGWGPEEFDVGRFYQLQEFSVHYLCILTGFNLPQNGNSREGLLGFLLCDIIRAFRRYCRRKCLVCMKSGASLECEVCMRTYHLPCGMKSGMVVIQMLERYPSYCQECIAHEMMSSKKAPDESFCAICLSTPDGQRIYWPKCCKSDEWIHIECLQEYAVMAGYKTKCPLCSNKKKFRLSIRKHGVYIPSEDATWLSDDELTYPTVHILQCSAQVCVVFDGALRNILVGCAVCSDNLGHYECTFAGIFVCPDCTQQLWPEDCLSILHRMDQNSRLLFLLRKIEKIKATFPWLLDLLTSLAEDKQSQTMIMDIISAIDKELRTNKINPWYKILVTDENINVLLSKIRECRENFLRTFEVTFHPNRHPADEDLQQIELESLRGAAKSHSANDRVETDDAQEVLNNDSAPENKGGRLPITEMLLKRLKQV